MTSVRVGGPEESGYDVLIGEGLLESLPGLLGGDARRVLLVHPRALRATATAVLDVLSAAGLRPLAFEAPDAEAAKTVDVLAACWAVLGQAGFTRTDAVVGLGG